jgi:CheY-like chemotaxis protein
MTDLSTLRVLVVEDEGPIALMIEDMLEELGCTIAGSAGHLAKAREIAATAEIDLALLDVNLLGQPVFSVAEILRDRKVPVVFSTGYGAGGLPEEFRGYVALGKPFSQLELRQAIVSAMKSETVVSGSENAPR